MALLNGKSQKEVAKESIDSIMDAVNIIGSDKEVVDGIMESLQMTHRTLQQNFWRVMSQVIIQYSDFRTDLRNEGSVQMCKEIRKLLEENPQYLPYV